MREFLHDDGGTASEAVIADGSKCHNRADGGGLLDVNVTPNRAVIRADGDTTLLYVNADGSWSSTAAWFRETR